MSNLNGARHLVPVAKPMNPVKKNHSPRKILRIAGNMKVTAAVNVYHAAAALLPADGASVSC